MADYDRFLHLELPDNQSAFLWGARKTGKSTYLQTEKRDEIFYWRTKDQYEVDFVFGNQAIEVKMRDNIDKSHIKNLLVFARENDNMKLNIICLEKVKRIVQLGDQEIVIWPVEEFLKELWNGCILI
jgi:predicted AAA+ superfamily ATPase